MFDNLEEANKQYSILEQKLKDTETARVSLDNLRISQEKQINELQGTMEELRQANMHLWKNVPREGNIGLNEVPEEPKQKTFKKIPWDDFLSDF